MKKKTSVGSKIILTLTMLFFYLPILYIIIFSFNDSRSLTKFGGFSLRWYEKMFADSTMMEAVLYTVIIAVIATVVATVVGTITAVRTEAGGQQTYGVITPACDLGELLQVLVIKDFDVVS